MRGSSFHVKTVQNPQAAEAHNLRAWSDKHQAPGYLLPAEHSLGFGRVIAVADVVETHTQLMSLASPQARRDKRYSPVWEGVLNLAQPPADYREQVIAFARGYEKITGQRVIAADVHLDEGRVENGRAILNAHAHITIDRCDERGRVIKLNRAQLRQVQDLAAQVTGLARGDDARETRRKHIAHGAYRALAKRGLIRSREIVQAVEPEPAAKSQRKRARIDIAAALSQQPQQMATAAAEPSTDELYGVLRSAMRVSGRATQQHYVEAKTRKGDRAWLEAQVAMWEPALDAAAGALAAERRRREAQEAAGRAQASRPPSPLTEPPTAPQARRRPPGRGF